MHVSIISNGIISETDHNFTFLKSKIISDIKQTDIVNRIS